MKSLLLISILLTFSFSEPIYIENRTSNQVSFDLAIKYALGTEVKRDERKAFNLFHKAAREGHLEATYLMGVCFDQGRGVRVQKNLARYWFKLAAKRGHPRANFRLAMIEKDLNQKREISRFARR